MQFITIQIAGKVFKTGVSSSENYFFLKDFATEKEAEFDLSINRKEIEDELFIHHAIDRIPNLSYSRLEICILLRLVSDILIDDDTLLFHGATISLDHASYLFSAPSQTGKTTHTKLWLKNCPDAFVVNGDKTFIHFQDPAAPPLACCSPWAGKERLYTNIMVPLKSIILMERAEDNHIEQISFAEAFPALLQQVYRPDDPEKMRKTLRLMQRLKSTVTFWRFQCNNFKDDCFQVAYSALHG